MGMETLTDRLAAAVVPLLEAGVTQADLARRVGVSRATVGDWLHGRASSLRADTLFAVADALNVEARWLATGKGPRTRQALGSDERAMLNAYAKLTPPERITLRTLANQIADAHGEYNA